MQPKSRLAHILGLFRRIERRQDQPQPVKLVGFQLPPVIFFKQQAQAFMPETPYHPATVKRQLTFVKKSRPVAARQTMPQPANSGGFRPVMGMTRPKRANLENTSVAGNHHINVSIEVSAVLFLIYVRSHE